MGRASRSAQESACSLPPSVGGHKGRILIDSDASRSLPCPRRRRNLLLFEYVHIHSTTSGRGCCPLLSVREAIQQRDFKNALHFFVTDFSIRDRVRLHFCNITVSMLLKEYLLFHPHNVLSGIDVINKTQFLPF
jgi:hypothetical protein